MVNDIQWRKLHGRKPRVPISADSRIQHSNILKTNITWRIGKQVDNTRGIAETWKELNRFDCGAHNDQISLNLESRECLCRVRGDRLAGKELNLCARVDSKCGIALDQGCIGYKPELIFGQDHVLAD